MTTGPSDTPALITFAADVVLLSTACAPPQHEECCVGALHVLLITRRWPPYEGCLALPGGHVDADETSEAGARRELAEETGLTAPDGLRQIDIYDVPDRDPRGRVVSVAYVAQMLGMPAPTAGDDAATAHWVPVNALLGRDILAFDHESILRDAIMRVEEVATLNMAPTVLGLSVDLHTITEGWHPTDIELCAACDLLSQTCPFHQGVDAGARRLASIIGAVCSDRNLTDRIGDGLIDLDESVTAAAGGEA